VTPPSWADVSRDLEVAMAEARQAVAKDVTLPGLPDAQREDRELAIGKHLHDAYSAAEKALERVLELVDGELPAGRHFHRDLLARAARAVAGRRPAIISAATAEELDLLLSFRHVFRHQYGRFNYGRAQANVATAGEVMPKLREEVAALAVALGLPPAA